MSYALKHSPTGTLLACVQRNGYKLAYYGLLLWEDVPSPAQMVEGFAEAGIDSNDPAGKLEDWEPLELSEHDAKMANVKLRNDPARIVAYREGVIISRNL